MLVALRSLLKCFRFISIPLNLARGQFLRIWSIDRGRILFALQHRAVSSKPQHRSTGGGGRKRGQNEPRAIISMARQLRSSRGHLLLRARRPDDRSSFNNLPPRVPPRGSLFPPRVSQLQSRSPPPRRFTVRAFFPLVGPHERWRRKLRNRYCALARARFVAR